MNKLFSKIAALSVGLAMAVGVGVALGHQSVKEAKAEEPGDYTLTITYDSFGIKDTSYKHRTWTTTTTGGTVINGTGSVVTNNGDKYIQVNKASTRAAAIYNTTALPGKITKISAKWADTTKTARTFNGYLMDSASTHGTGNADYTRADGAVLINASPVSYGSTTDEVVLGTSTDDHRYFSFEEAENGASYFSEIKIYYTVVPVEGELNGLELSKYSTSGYLVGDTFGKDEFDAEGVAVEATYDSGDKKGVTTYSVETVTLVEGDNEIAVSYEENEVKVTATFVVNAKTQEEYDAEAAAAVDSIITSIDMTKSGYEFINPVRNVYMEYEKLNENAKSKVQYKSIYDGNVNSDSNYILFFNSLSNDSGSRILEGDEPNPAPETWHVPSTLSLKSGSAAYNGRESTLKLGGSSATGSLTFELVDKTYSFTKIAVGATKYGSDSGVVTMSGTETQVTPAVGGAEVEPIDISSAKLTEITVGTTLKRAYIDYIYVEYEKNEDVLDSDITVTGTLSKNTYIEGQYFDPSGLSFAVSYNEGAISKSINASDISWNPSPLTSGTTSVTGTYMEGTSSATCVISSITVNPYVVTNYGQVGQPIADYSGSYYLYNSDAGRIWKATDPSNTYSSIEAAVTNNEISSSVFLDEGIVTIEKVDGGYYLKNANGNYVGPNTSGLSSGVVNAAELEAGSLHTITSVGDDGVVTMSATYGESTTVYLRFNAASNQLKVRYYEDQTKVKGVILFKADAAPVKTNLQEVDAFVQNYMHPEISYEDESDTNACRADGEGAMNYYGLASTAFNELSERQRELFVSEEAYEKPYARLQAWAVANSEEFNSSNLLVPSASESFFSSKDVNNNSYIIIIVISSVSVLSFGLALFLRKKRSK